MKKALLVACLLALSVGFLGCAAESTTFDPRASTPGAGAAGGAAPEPEQAASSSGAAASYGPAQGSAGAAPGPSRTTPSQPGDERPSPSEFSDPDDGLGDSQPSSAPDTSTEASLESQLQRLDALELFEVGDLVSAVPGENYSCAYNQPCPGGERDAVMRSQQARLASLVGISETVAGTAELPQSDGTAEEHLAALRSLSIVRIGALVVDEAASSGNCYNLPCPRDVEAAAASNARRYDVLAELAQQASGL